MNLCLLWIFVQLHKALHAGLYGAASNGRVVSCGRRVSPIVVFSISTVKDVSLSSCWREFRIRGIFDEKRYYNILTHQLSNAIVWIWEDVMLMFRITNKPILHPSLAIYAYFYKVVLAWRFAVKKFHYFGRFLNWHLMLPRGYYLVKFLGVMRKDFFSCKEFVNCSEPIIACSWWDQDVYLTAAAQREWWWAQCCQYCNQRRTYSIQRAVHKWQVLGSNIFSSYKRPTPVLEGNIITTTALLSTWYYGLSSYLPESWTICNLCNSWISSCKWPYRLHFQLLLGIDAAQVRQHCCYSDFLPCHRANWFWD